MRFGDIASQGTITPLPSDFSISGQVQGDLLYFNGTNWVRLAPGSSGQHLKTNGAAANPAWETIPTPTNLNITNQATGDMLYYNGSAWVRLAAGTSTYLLQANGAAAPTWVAAPSSGTNIKNIFTFTTEIALGVGRYCSFGGFESTSNNAHTVISASGTIKNLYFNCYDTVNGGTLRCSLYKNYGGTSFGNLDMPTPGSQVSDTSNSFTVVAGDVISAYIVNSATGANRIISVSVQLIV